MNTDKLLIRSTWCVAAVVVVLLLAPTHAYAHSPGLAFAALGTGVGVGALVSAALKSHHLSKRNLPAPTAWIVAAVLAEVVIVAFVGAVWLSIEAEDDLLPLGLTVTYVVLSTIPNLALMRRAGICRDLSGKFFQRLLFFNILSLATFAPAYLLLRG